MANSLQKILRIIKQDIYYLVVTVLYLLFCWTCPVIVNL